MSLLEGLLTSVIPPEYVSSRSAVKEKKRRFSNGEHQSSLVHDAPHDGGVRAYVILSHGRKVGLRSRQVEDIRKRFGVRVYAREVVSVNGLDALPGLGK